MIPLKAVLQSVVATSHRDYFLVGALGLVWVATVAFPSIASEISLTIESDASVGDQAQYIAAAESLLDSGRLLDAANEPFTLYPIGLPVLGALLGWAVGKSASFALVNSLALLVLAIGTLGVARVVLLPRFLAIASSLIVLTSPVVLLVGQRVWTEPVFAAAIVVFVWIAGQVARTGECSSRCALSLVLVTAVATSVKYLGVALILVLALLLWWMYRRRGFGAWHGVLIVGAASLPTAVMVARNIFLGSGLFGNRSDSYLRADDAVSESLQEFGVLILSPQTSQAYRSIGVVLAFVCILSVFWFWRRQNRAGYLLWATFMSYWGLLWISQSSSHVDPTGPRFLMPMVAPVVVLSEFWLNEMCQESLGIAQSRGSVWSTRLRLVPAVLAVAWIFLNLSYTVGVGSSISTS